MSISLASVPQSKTIRKNRGASSQCAARATCLPKPRTETWMRRLYLQIYLTIVGSLVLVVITAGLLWHFMAGVPPFGQPFEIAGEVLAELVPPADAPLAQQQQVIDRWARRLGADLALYGAGNEPIAA